MIKPVATVLVASAFSMIWGCSSYGPSVRNSGSHAIVVGGDVEKVCAACKMADFTSGEAPAWDVLSVRLKSPDSYSGLLLRVEVFVEGDGTEQRRRYEQSSRIEFLTGDAAIKSGRLMLRASDIRAIGAVK